MYVSLMSARLATAPFKSSPICHNTRALYERRRRHPCATPTRASSQTQLVHFCYLWQGAAEVSYLLLLRQWRLEINPGIRTAGLCKKACRSATALECTLSQNGYGDHCSLPRAPLPLLPPPPRALLPHILPAVFPKKMRGTRNHPCSGDGRLAVAVRSTTVVSGVPTRAQDRIPLAVAVRRTFGGTA